MKKILLFILCYILLGCKKETSDCCTSPPIVTDNYIYFRDVEKNDLLENIEIIHREYYGYYIREERDVLNPEIYKWKQNINQEKIVDDDEIAIEKDKEGRLYLKFSSTFFLEEEGIKTLSHYFSCPYLFGSDEYQEIRIDATYYKNTFEQTAIFLNGKEGIYTDWGKSPYWTEFILSKQGN